MAVVVVLGINRALRDPVALRVAERGDPETKPASIGTDTFANGLQSALLYMPWSWLVIVALVLALVAPSPEPPGWTSPVELRYSRERRPLTGTIRA